MNIEEKVNIFFNNLEHLFMKVYPELFKRLIKEDDDFKAIIKSLFLTSLYGDALAFEVERALVILNNKANDKNFKKEALEVYKEILIEMKFNKLKNN